MFPGEGSIDPVRPLILQTGSVLHHVAVPCSGTYHIDHGMVGEAVIAHVRVNVGCLGVNPWGAGEVDLKRGRHGFEMRTDYTMHQNQHQLVESVELLLIKH